MNRIDQNSNFGPNIESNRSVKILLEEIEKLYDQKLDIEYKKDFFHETTLLNLQIDKAFRELNWFPKWNFEQTIQKTINWYKNFYQDPSKAYDLCVEDLNCFMESK